MNKQRLLFAEGLENVVYFLKSLVRVLPFFCSSDDDLSTGDGSRRRGGRESAEGHVSGKREARKCQLLRRYRLRRGR